MGEWPVRNSNIYPQVVFSTFYIINSVLFNFKLSLKFYWKSQAGLTSLVNFVWVLCSHTGLSCVICWKNSYEKARNPKKQSRWTGDLWVCPGKSSKEEIRTNRNSWESSATKNLHCSYPRLEKLRTAELQKHSFNNICKYSCSFFMNNINTICTNIKCREFVILVAGSWYHSRDTKWHKFLRCKRKKRESGEVINHELSSQNPYHKIGFLTMVNLCKNTFFPHPLCKCDLASQMLLK